MMSLDAVVGRPPLVLLVDPVVTSRHWMWRALNRTFGVLEAANARGAREWIARRPDIDALVVQDELPDQRGCELVRELASASHPIASRSIVLARPSPEWARLAQAGATLVERGDLRALLSKLAGWFLTRDAGLARALLREADRRSA
jgi:response regulator RpfG family c-di-GMP phosphodiesterase